MLLPETGAPCSHSLASMCRALGVGSVPKLWRRDHHVVQLFCLSPQDLCNRLGMCFHPSSWSVIVRRWGIWIMCTVILHKGYWASIASPLFVMLLILKGSGVPLQEKQVSS